MKKIILFLALAFISAISVSAQNPEYFREIDVTVLLDSADYILEFESETNLCYISNTPQSKYAFVDDCQEIGSPWIPWCSVMIPILQDEEYVSFTSSVVEAFIVDTVLIAPYSALMPVSCSKAPVLDTVGEDVWDGTYPNEIYPDHSADYVSTIRIPDWAKDIYKADKVICLQICPFRYYAQEQVLKLVKVQLQVTVKGVVVDGITLPSKESTNSQFLDFSGRRLTTPPTQKGIYIRDGKKVLIK